MGINSNRMRGAQLACGLLLACIGYSASAQQLVNSDATGAGMPLLDPPGRYPLYVNAPGFYILDTSAKAATSCSAITQPLQDRLENRLNLATAVSGARIGKPGNC